jgi:hypothetical protein
MTGELITRIPCQSFIPGSLAEFIIGPRFARTRWLAPRNNWGDRYAPRWVMKPEITM